MLSVSYLVRQWRCIVTVGAGLCCSNISIIPMAFNDFYTGVVGMMIARKLYVRSFFVDKLF